jgi:hypothetical protein
MNADNARSTDSGNGPAVAGSRYIVDVKTHLNHSRTTDELLPQNAVATPGIDFEMCSLSELDPPWPIERC